MLERKREKKTLRGYKTEERESEERESGGSRWARECEGKRAAGRRERLEERKMKRVVKRKRGE